MSDGPHHQNPHPAMTTDPAAANAAAGLTPDFTDRFEGIGNEVHLSDYLRVLYKRRRPALTVFLLVFLATCVYTFTATPTYSAKVQILIEKEASNVVAFKEAVEQNQVTDDYYQTQYKILQSRALARRTLDALHLWQNSHFGDGPQATGPRAVLSALVPHLSIGGSREQSAPDETAAQSRAIDRFLGNLTVSPVRNSRLVDVSYESTDPGTAALVANGIAKAYIEQNLEFRFMASKEASDWLSARLAEQRAQVEGSEQVLQRYREQTNDAVSLEERQNIVVQKLADLNTAVTRAKTERIEKETAYNQIRGIQNNYSALDNVPAVLANGFVQQQKAELADLQRQQAQLSERLGVNHPDMVKIGAAIRASEAKIHAEMAKIVEAMRNDYERALTQERSLTAALDQQKREALDLNRKAIQYGVLTRDAATNRQIFDSLLQRTKETGISGELRTSNIRVVDPAETPRRPQSPNRRSNLLVGLFSGTILAIGVALFFEYVDNRIKAPDEVARYLKVPFLGMVPALFDQDTDTALIHIGSRPQFAESFKSLRTNVLFSAADEGMHSVVVTSTAPSEGKTVVATNLAVALAQSGLRVLLIDADMRRPRVHSVFDKPREPGLSDFLIGRARVSETVRPAVPGLWIMSAGTAPPNPSELLNSKRFADLIESLGQHFDWAIIDTPPVMAVTDATIAAHITKRALFVIGAEMTNHFAATRAIDQLKRSNARVLGAVLNRVDLKNNGYYYSHYYRREYSDYYSETA